MMRGRDTNKMTHPMFPNEDTKVTCGRHPGCSCTEAHDSHVAGLIERDHEIERLTEIIINANEEMCELRCARDAMIEVLDMAIPQGANNKRHFIFKSEGGEEEVAWIIPKDEVESVLERYRPPPKT